MERIVLKPTRSKTLVFWASFAAVVLVLFLVLTWDEITDLTLLLIVVAISLGQSLVFSVLFYKLPYFRVVLEGDTITGPRGLGGGWQRVTIPLQDLDLENVSDRFKWWGFYVIPSTTGERLSLWGFGEDQYKELVGLVREGA